MAKTIPYNHINRFVRKISYATLIAIIAFVPYLIRLYYYSVNQVELPEFYKCDMDLIAYSLAIALAILVENKGKKFDSIQLILGLVFIGFPILMLHTSLSLEASYKKIEAEMMGYINFSNVVNKRELSKSFEWYTTQREQLFSGSKLLAKGLTIIWFLVIIINKERGGVDDKN